MFVEGFFQGMGMLCGVIVGSVALVVLFLLIEVVITFISKSISILKDKSRK